MFWAVLSFLTAISEATKDLFSKKGLQKIDEYIVAWSLRIFSLIFLLPLLFFIEIPVVDKTFFFALLIGGSMDVITSVLYMKAIKSSPLSVTIPMITFTPVFLLITSPIILGEFPTAFGLLGIFLIVFGSYFLNIKEIRKGFSKPLKALVNEKGPVIMLCVAFIWSISANIDKIGVQHSNPVFWVIAINIFLSIALFPIVYIKSRKNLNKISKNAKMLLPIGLFSALGLVFQMTAITMTIVPYVISIKRISAIISVIYGFVFFKEKDIKQRFFGASIMILGVILITLF